MGEFLSDSNLFQYPVFVCTDKTTQRLGFKPGESSFTLSVVLNRGCPSLLHTCQAHPSKALLVTRPEPQYVNGSGAANERLL
jgi:hypothetical protein